MIQQKKHRLSLVSSVFFLPQPTGHWFSCQMGVCHWSPSVAKTDKDQRQPMFLCCIIWAYLTQLPSQFCQIPIIPSRIRQAVEHSNSKSTQWSPRADGTPCSFTSLSPFTQRYFKFAVEFHLNFFIYQDRRALRICAKVRRDGSCFTRHC